MSTNYIFYLSTVKTPQEIRRLMAEVNKTDLNDSKAPHFFYIATNESSIRISYLSEAHENENTRAQIEQDWREAYGFIPNIKVDIVYYSNYDPEQKSESIRKSIIKLLESEHGNAVLIIDAGVTVLERINEQIVVTNEQKYSFNGYNWLKKGLEHSGLKYEERLLEYRQV
jgi:hypothetical protein